MVPNETRIIAEQDAVIFTGLPYGNPSQKMGILLFLLGCQTQSESRFHFVGFLLFSVSGKVLPVTSLLSGVFVHRVFCAYFVRFEGLG